MDADEHRLTVDFYLWLFVVICGYLWLSVVDAVGRILTRECVRPRTPKNAICPSSWLPATLNANDSGHAGGASDPTIIPDANAASRAPDW